jgi:hypothetical protein
MMSTIERVTTWRREESGRYNCFWKLALEMSKWLWLWLWLLIKAGRCCYFFYS